jgi:hypothetical protein
MITDTKDSSSPTSHTASSSGHFRHVSDDLFKDALTDDIVDASLEVSSICYILPLLQIITYI